MEQSDAKVFVLNACYNEGLLQKQFFTNKTGLWQSTFKRKTTTSSDMCTNDKSKKELQLKGGCVTTAEGTDMLVSFFSGELRTKRWFQGKGCPEDGKLAEQSFEPGLCEICQNDDYTGYLSVEVFWSGPLISKQIFGDDKDGCKRKATVVQIAEVGKCMPYNDNSYRWYVNFDQDHPDPPASQKTKT